MFRILLLVLFVPGVCLGADRWSALSMLESGNNDYAVGSAGEISRFQILKREWKRFSYSTQFSDLATAQNVANQIMKQRMGSFVEIHHREPSNFEFYVLWNAPRQALTGRVSRVVAERARRFANLCAIELPAPRLYASRQL